MTGGIKENVYVLRCNIQKYTDATRVPIDRFTLNFQVSISTSAFLDKCVKLSKATVFFYTISWGVYAKHVLVFWDV